VTLPRVVSTTCSNTEIVCALGCASALVGTDDYSDYPPEVVAHLPRVGPDLGIDPARVKALAPDLVLASLTVPGHERVVAALRAAGLPVLAPAPRSIADVLADVRTIARALGVEARGIELAASMERELAPRSPRADGAPPPRILIEWWPKPVIVPGRRSWATDLIARAGGVNPLADADVESTPLAPGEVDGLGVEAIVIAWCGVPTAKYRPRLVATRPGWADVPAVRAGRIQPISEAFLGRPGPRLVCGLQALRAVVDLVHAERERSPGR